MSGATNTKMTKDTVLYMIAKGFEGIVGMATITVMSYIFIDVEIGIYTQWNIVATTAAMLSIQWLSQSASRYLNEYEVKNEKNSFYSTVFFAWLKINLIVIATSCIIVFIFMLLGANNAPEFLQPVYSGQFQSLFVLAVIYFITYNTSQLLIALLSVKRKPVANLIISFFSVTCKLTLILFFSKIVGAKVQIIFISYIISDIAVIIFAVSTMAALKYIHRKNRSKELLNDFGKYGLPLVGNLATTTVLNNSDRFVIQSKAEVGVYSQSYSIVSSVFTMLATALMRGSYPTILKTYALGDKELTERLVSQAVRNYLMLSVPAVVGISVLAKPLAELVLSPGFVEGYKVMMWVAIGMMFLGLTEYSNKPWELSAQTGYIFRNSLISGIINLGLNIIFIPVFGYLTAAYSTFIGFFIYFCLSRFGSRKLMKWHVTRKTYLSIFGSSAIMGFSIFAAKSLMGGASKLMIIVYILLGVVIYGVSLTLTGEVREEAALVRNLLKRRVKK